MAVVQASGESDQVTVSAATAVELLPLPAATIALVGNNRLTERSPADLHVVVTNPSDATVTVTLSASAGKHDASLDVPAFELKPKQAKDVALTVRADGALRRGNVGLVVRGEVTGAGQTQQLVVTRELSVAVAADELPGPLGVGTMVVVPGLVALLVFFEVRALDRKRIGVSHPGAMAVWNDKTWLLAAGGASLAAATV